MKQFTIPVPREYQGKPFKPQSNPGDKELFDRLVVQRKVRDKGEAYKEFEVINFGVRDDGGPFALVAPPSDIAEQDVIRNGGFPVNLEVSQCKPAAGASVAGFYEASNKGMYMTYFYPYQALAYFEPMSDEQLRVRQVVAGKLGVDPWYVAVRPTEEKGWALTLDKSVSWDEKRHGPRMQEAVEQVGAFGWHYEVDGLGRNLLIHPGLPPTFPKTAAFDLGLLDHPDFDKAVAGVGLARPGEEPALLSVDFAEDAGLLVTGTKGGGKSVLINDILSQQVAAGVELYVVDHSSSETDFYYARPWMAPHGMGSRSLLEAAGLLKWLFDDIDSSHGGRRVAEFQRHGWNNWYQLPASARQEMPMRLVVVDELAQLTTGGKEVTSIPKNALAPVLEGMLERQLMFDIAKYLRKITQVGRKLGYRWIVATQVASASAGMDPTVKRQCGHKVIQGQRVSEQVMDLGLDQPKNMPRVPQNVIAEGVGRGVGLAELAGVRSQPFKPLFAGGPGDPTGVMALGRALARRRGLPEGVGQDAYLRGLEAGSPPDPVLEGVLDSRVRFPESLALSILPTEALLREGD